MKRFLGLVIASPVEAQQLNHLSHNQIVSTMRTM